MNWEAIGAVGEIVGALAVVVTLIYLATQVRYAKQAAADQNRLVRASGVREMALTGVTDDEFRLAMDRNWGSDQLYKQLAEQAGISPEEVSKADWGNVYWFWLHWGQFTSTHEEADLEELKNLVSKFYSLPGVKRSWETSPLAKPIIDPKFVEFVDGILESSSSEAAGDD